ncbi:hypothetical protein [Phenylobacterium aquaticum]|uniref:hypothetical protein n=1 Tax=Phenylobacterium aquaticum TaxID=1763816 RepID=UPI001F5C96B4|nr:hypothetical protein [Phenylobacterium aquaticum]MCI3131699.1 hypothetical protein [Phenylobacterium aquaticum]
MSEDAHHDSGGAAKAAGAPVATPVAVSPPPAPAYSVVVPAPGPAAPASYPIIIQAPAPAPYPPAPPSGLQGFCRCGLTPWPQAFLCACMAPPKAEEKKKDEHKAPAGPPPPAFSAAVPADFPKRFEYVWASLGKVMEGKAPPHGVIADARALLDLLLDDLDPEGRGRFVTEGAWIWKKTTYRAHKAKPRLHRLIEKGVLLKPLKDVVDRLAWTPEEEAARGVRGDPDLAKRLVHLVWQVADQGFEQRTWSELAEAPPRVAPPAAAHGGDAHGAGGGHGDGHGGDGHH